MVASGVGEVSATRRADPVARLWPWLNLAFALLATTSVGLVLADGSIGWPHRLGSLVPVGAMVAGYLILIRPVGGYERHRWARGAVYSAIAVVGGAVSFAIHPSYWFLCLAVFFQVWMFLPVRIAALVSAGLSLALWTIGSQLDGSGFHPTPGAIAIFVAVALLSTMLGLLIEAIARQSGQRLDLITSLRAERVARELAEREAGALAERARLSRDLHDTLAQGFTSIVLHLEAADAVLEAEAPARRPVADARRIARDNLNEVRRLVWALRPAPLRDADLSAALGRMAATWSAEHGVAASFRVEGEPMPMAPAIEVTLLRATQEALTNIARHAGAREVDIALTLFPEAVHLDVRDDGHGFDPHAGPVPGDVASGFGLRGLRERVSALGGSVEIESAPGSGTTIAVVIPTDCAAPAGAEDDRSPEVDPVPGHLQDRPDPVPSMGREGGSAMHEGSVGSGRSNGAAVRRWTREGVER